MVALQGISNAEKASEGANRSCGRSGFSRSCGAMGVGDVVAELLDFFEPGFFFPLRFHLASNLKRVKRKKLKSLFR